MASPPYDRRPDAWAITGDTQAFIDETNGLALTDSGPVPLPPSPTIELAGTIDGEATVTADLYNVAGNIRELAGTIGGEATVTGTLKVTIELSGAVAGEATLTADLRAVFTVDPIEGQATVTGHLTNLSAFGGEISGSTTVTGYLAPILYGFGGIPIQIGFGGIHIVDPPLPPVYGRTNVTGTLTVIRELTGTVAGQVTVSGGFTATGIFFGTHSVTGQATVTGILDNGLLDGDGDIIIELAGTIAGSTTVVDNWYMTRNRPGSNPNTGYVVQVAATWWYQYTEVGVAFDDIDDASSHPDYVSQSYPDGNLVAIDYPVLYQYINVGVGFGPIDDASTRPDFVAQTYPDGLLTDIDYPAFYQYTNIIPGVPEGFNQLVILPGWTPKVPPSKAPPKGVNQ